MKNLVIVLSTVTITFIITMIFVMVKFGGFNISNHTDHYVTTCNGEVISERDDIVTDRIDFNVNINEGWNIFSR